MSESCNNEINIKEKKTTDRTKYTTEHRKLHPELWYANNKCETCGGKFQTANKSNHVKTKKHKYALMELKLKQISNLIV